MKKFLIIASIIFIILSGIFLANQSNATVTMDEIRLYSKEQYTDMLRFGDINILCNFVVYEKDGVEYPAYCVQREYDGVTVADDYTVTTEALTNVMVWRAIINGYPYKTYQELGCTTKEQAYLATKQAVYCMLYNRDGSEYSAIGEEGELCLNALKQIVNAARSSNETKISSNIDIKSNNSKWEIDNLNSKYVSKSFEALSVAGMNEYQVIIEGELPEGTIIADEQNNEKDTFKYGEKFKILMPITNILEDDNFIIKVKGKVNTKPILYGRTAREDIQDYALTGAIYEDGEGTHKEYYTKNETSIKIIKKDADTEESLEGVKFQLLNENHEVIYSDLTTDANGEIFINNLLPGIYYIRETDTLMGYQRYDKLIKVELVLNEISSVTVNNSETVEITPKVEKFQTEIEVEQTKSEIEVEMPKPVKLPRTGM